MTTPHTDNPLSAHCPTLSPPGADLPRIRLHKCPRAVVASLLLYTHLRMHTSHPSLLFAVSRPPTLLTPPLPLQQRRSRKGSCGEGNPRCNQGGRGCHDREGFEIEPCSFETIALGLP